MLEVESCASPLAYRILVPVTEAFSFTFLWKNIIVARNCIDFFFVSFFYNFFLSKSVLFFDCLHKPRDTLRGSAHVAFCISGIFSLRIGDLQQNRIYIYYNEEHFSRARIILTSVFPSGFLHSVVYFALWMHAMCPACIFFFLETVRLPLDVTVFFYDENCVFVRFVSSCDCSSRAGFKCIWALKIYPLHPVHNFTYYQGFTWTFLLRVWKNGVLRVPILFPPLILP